jgi:hypothetical protein
VSAYDPLLSADEVRRVGAAPWAWGQVAPFRAVVTQTADPRWRDLDLAGWFPELEIVLDGRNSLRDLRLPPGVRLLGIGVPPRG